MATHVDQPAASQSAASQPSAARRARSRTSAAARTMSAGATRPRVRWTPARIGLTGLFGTVCAATVAVGLWLLPPLVSGWSRLTPFEQPIGWLVIGALVLMTAAMACATAAAAVWPQRVADDEPTRTAGDQPQHDRG